LQLAACTSHADLGPILQASLPMQDGTKEMVPYFIALGHELIHADRSRLGITDFNTYELDRQRIKTYEECETFTLENLLRTEHKLNVRYVGY
jgi:hypothetical protein